MRILLYRGDGVIEPWARDFAQALPQAETVVWQEGQALEPCDYAVLWAPTPALLDQLSRVKAIFLMGAGVDAILKFGDALPDVPVIRLGDALEGVRIEPVTIMTAYAEILGASDATVVEGVGGFCVPFSDDFDSADLAVQLGLPVILVVGMRLGCINHALLTAEAIISRGLVLAGWVANQVDPGMRFVDENVAALEQRMPAPLLGRVPRLEQASAADAAAYIDLAGVPGWPLMRS